MVNVAEGGIVSQSQSRKKGTGYANGIHNRKDDHIFQSLGFR